MLRNAHHLRSTNGAYMQGKRAVADYMPLNQNFVTPHLEVLPSKDNTREGSDYGHELK